jgi:hypothetical protein
VFCFECQKKCLCYLCLIIGYTETSEKSHSLDLVREPWLIRPSNDEDPGLPADLGIAGFDDTDGREMLLDVRITDMDCPANIKTGPPRAILHKHEAEKIRIYRLPAQNMVGPSHPS